MPAQLEIIRKHIADAIARGGQALLGGDGAVGDRYVQPTILVDVPEESEAVREETFGPTLTIAKVHDMDEAVTKANDTRYGLGATVFSRRRGMELARRLRSGMTSVNDVLAFAGMTSLPWGGVGASGIGRLRGADGLREFGQAKSIVVRQLRSVLPSRTFARTDRDVSRIVTAYRLMFGRSPR
jgi:acyl-CoA reductase-like NAD-dependent aldehyde dehydrogenase